MKHEIPVAEATKPLSKAAKRAARRAAKEAAAVAAAAPKLAAEEELEPVAVEEVVAPVKVKPAKVKAEKVPKAEKAEKRAIARTIRLGDAAGWKRDLHIGQRELAEALAIFEEREGKLPTEKELLDETVELFGPANAPRRSKVHAESPREYFRGYLAMGLTLGNFVVAA